MRSKALLATGMPLWLARLPCPAQRLRQSLLRTLLGHAILRKQGPCLLEKIYGIHGSVRFQRSSGVAFIRFSSFTHDPACITVRIHVQDYTL